MIFWWKFFENIALQLIPSFLYEVGIEFSGHYILRFILSPPTSIPPTLHIDRFGATCSLPSQEDGKIPPASFSPSSCNNALQRDGRRKLPWLHFQVLLGRSTVCTMINSVGLARGAPCSGGAAQLPVPNPLHLHVSRLHHGTLCPTELPAQVSDRLCIHCWCHPFLP